MGQLLSSKSGSKEVKLSINGLSNAGKKSILKKMEAMAGERSAQGGTNIVANSYKNITFIDWDIGGRASSRPLYQLMYAKYTDAIIIVVDSSAEFEVFLENVFWSVTLLRLEQCVKDTIFLVLANKQDLPGALPVEEIAKKINYEELSKSHVTNIMGCSAETGEGLQEAMNWLAGELEKKVKKEEEINQTEKQGKKKKSWASRVKGSFQAMKSIVKSG